MKRRSIKVRVDAAPRELTLTLVEPRPVRGPIATPSKVVELLAPLLERLRASP